jgi:hypothetical protein
MLPHDFLMAGDPAIRWQALRDLRGAAASSVSRERAKVARDGWGAQILARQDADGRWGGGLYTPKWISTTYTMALLRSFGVAPGHPQMLRAARVMLDSGHWPDGGINFYPKRYERSETCITGTVLASLCASGLDDPRVDAVADYLISVQMADGGWNCCAIPGYGRGCATHASFHTTIVVLEALLEYERFRPDRTEAARKAQERGREFFLVHRLFRSHRTGEVVKPEMLRFIFPPRWHFDVLRGLDYFQDSQASRDPRLGDAIELVEKRRQADGLWKGHPGYPGKTFFELENPGEPSRWNTLRALRVLRWWTG